MEVWKEDFIHANGIRIHYVTAGTGPLIILLHGFPQFWYTWRHQIPLFAEHFQVVAPDLRGYGKTDRPKTIGDYHLSHLAADVKELVHALGRDKAHIVGHDWGGAAAWRVAQEFPEVVDHLVVLNSPHPYIFAKALQSNFRQMAKSWYVFFFQLPKFPEYLFQRYSKGILRRLLKGSTVRKDAFTEKDLEQYEEAMAEPGAWESAINYYRAAFQKPSKEEIHLSKSKKISAPTLLIWGEDDTALGKELTQGMEPLFTGLFQIHMISNCSHWVNEEQPQLVARLIMDFVGSKTMPNESIKE